MFTKVFKKDIRGSDEVWNMRCDGKCLTVGEPPRALSTLRVVTSAGLQKDLLFNIYS